MQFMIREGFALQEDSWGTKSFGIVDVGCGAAGSGSRGPRRLMRVLLGDWLGETLVDAFAYPYGTVDEFAKGVLVHIVEAFDVQAAFSGLVRT